jgi:hypothetical protein
MGDFKMRPSWVQSNRIMKWFESVNDSKLLWTHANSQTTIHVIIMKYG